MIPEYMVVQARVLADGHIVASQTSYNTGRNVLHCVIDGAEHAVETMADYEAILGEKTVERPMQLSFFDTAKVG